MTEHNCMFDGCGESFDNEVTREIHEASDHDLPWNEVDGWPRAESAR